MKVKRLIGLIAVFALMAAACGEGASDTTESELAQAPVGDELPVDPNAQLDPREGDATADPNDSSGPGIPPDSAIDEPASDPGPAETPPPSATTVDPPGGGDAPVFEEGVIDQRLSAFVDLAKADLAQRLGVSSAEIGVHSAVMVVWPDSSLGCPHPDMVYKQVPEDGSLIELTYGNTIYRYHTGGSRTEPFLCEQPLKEAPPVGDLDL